jgi:hypothetical protein
LAPREARGTGGAPWDDLSYGNRPEAERRIVHQAKPTNPARKSISSSVMGISESSFDYPPTNERRCAFQLHGQIRRSASPIFFLAYPPSTPRPRRSRRPRRVAGLVWGGGVYPRERKSGGRHSAAQWYNAPAPRPFRRGDNFYTPCTATVSAPTDRPAARNFFCRLSGPTGLRRHRRSPTPRCWQQ